MGGVYSDAEIYKSFMRPLYISLLSSFFSTFLHTMKVISSQELATHNTKSKAEVKRRTVVLIDVMYT